MQALVHGVTKSWTKLSDEEHKHNSANPLEVSTITHTPRGMPPSSSSQSGWSGPQWTGRESAERGRKKNTPSPSWTTSILCHRSLTLGFRHIVLVSAVAESEMM